MSLLDDVQAEVRKRAQAELVPLLLVRAVEMHKKHWRYCDCSWCRLKQVATVKIGSAGLHSRTGNPDQNKEMRAYYRRVELSKYRLERILLEQGSIL